MKRSSASTGFDTRSSRTPFTERRRSGLSQTLTRFTRRWIFAKLTRLERTSGSASFAAGPSSAAFRSEFFSEKIEKWRRWPSRFSRHRIVAAAFDVDVSKVVVVVALHFVGRLFFDVEQHRVGLVFETADSRRWVFLLDEFEFLWKLKSRKFARAHFAARGWSLGWRPFPFLVLVLKTMFIFLLMMT